MGGNRTWLFKIGRFFFPTQTEICATALSPFHAGTDTTTIALQWIMANLVKHQEMQKKLAEEIQAATRVRGQEEVEEEDLQGMPYLKAVILEGFVLPHAVLEETTLAGYTIPKNATVNFEVWEDPMEFRPERFLPGGEGADVDVTGVREIKMMPFGVGSRICPGQALTMLHLEYFVANLVMAFEWKAVDGEEVDLAEKADFTTLMKLPLRAHISPRGERSLLLSFCPVSHCLSRCLEQIKKFNLCWQP
ncbi:hypothetical protein Taro_009942 [Colocasia esculenta]|uniref:Cytochrome P450 n=1 Tax=Colocasia esculenta TaxID=4460 RepID=A0A843U695_COLES|nr:hypothetical protein [Colocasia esculenta]